MTITTSGEVSSAATLKQQSIAPDDRRLIATWWVRVAAEVRCCCGVGLWDIPLRCFPLEHWVWPPLLKLKNLL